MSRLRVHRRTEPPRDDRANGAVVTAASLGAAAAGVAFVVALVRGSRVTGVGLALAIGLLALALAVRRTFALRYPVVEVSEEREIGPDADGPLADVYPVRRRTLLARLLVGAAGVLGISLLAPVTSLGPRPGRVDVGTPWGRGTRVVDDDGRPLRPDDVPSGGIATVWPEGGVRVDTAAAALVRLAAPPSTPTNLDWVVADQLVAYSKICTHMGCPVGLFQEGADTLFCPCHQATFDARRGARPVFGPPARALPQLPLGTDRDGYLVALEDFRERVGPTTGRTT